MKWLCLVLITFTAQFLIAQKAFDVKAERLHIDTARIHSFLRASKSLQWVDPYRSLDYADSALKLSQEMQYDPGIALANNLRGFCFWAFGDNDLAVTAALEALPVAERENETRMQAEAYYILSRGYMDLNERLKANQYIEKAEKLANQSGSAELRCSVYNLKGVIKFIGQERDSALYYYTLAYETGKKHNVQPLHLPRIISNIGECYEKEDPAKAFTYFKQALALAKETDNKITEASITAIIGHTLLRQGSINDAENHLQHALNLSRRLGLRRTIRYSYAGLVDIKVKEGKSADAVKYLQQYYGVRDSLLSSAKIRQIVELESKHAIELKEQHVQILKKEARIAALWNNLLITIIVFIVIVSVSVYAWQRFRFRKNREMLNLEIDYLTRQKQTVGNQSSLTTDVDEPLETHDQKLLKKAIALVETHIGNSQFGVEMMASEMNMSRTHLHRKIKAITDFPPSELIRSIRLRKAAHFIANRVDSISQIALLVGFDDYAHFSKAFKKHFGVSPSAYEAEHARRRD